MQSNAGQTRYKPLVYVLCCLSSTETIRTIRDGEPRTAPSNFTQLLSSDLGLQAGITFRTPFHLALCVNSFINWLLLTFPPCNLIMSHRQFNARLLGRVKFRTRNCFLDFHIDASVTWSLSHRDFHIDASVTWSLSHRDFHIDASVTWLF